MKYINFIIFWALTTLALSRADMIGLLLSVVGFLVMHTLIEDSFDSEY
jgi:hypothetical protein